METKKHVFFFTIFVQIFEIIKESEHKMTFL